MDVDLDQRQRGIQREYLDFLDDGVRHDNLLLTFYIRERGSEVISAEPQIRRVNRAEQG